MTDEILDRALQVREGLERVRDALYQSPLIWFSRSGSGDQICAVTAAFVTVAEAASWAARHTGETVHFPSGNQLQAFYALENGLKHFTVLCGETAEEARARGLSQ